MLMLSDAAGALQALSDAVAEGTRSEAQIDEAVLHVLLWKYSCGLL